MWKCKADCGTESLVVKYESEAGAARVATAQQCSQLCSGVMNHILQLLEELQYTTITASSYSSYSVLALQSNMNHVSQKAISALCRCQVVFMNHLCFCQMHISIQEEELKHNLYYEYHEMQIK